MPDDNISTPTTATAPAELASEAAPTSNRSALLIVFLVVFIDLLGFGIVLPLLPRIGDDYIAVIIPGGKQAPMGGLIIGLLMASFSLMQFLVAPIWGRISDRSGRRPILLIGLAGSVVFYALFGLACTYSPVDHAMLALVLLFVARIGAGVAGATIATAQAVIADCTPPEKRKHGMALIGAAFGIGFAFGPLIGALAMTLFPANHEAVGYSAAGLSLIALLLGLKLLPETRQFALAPPIHRRLLNWSAIQIALAKPAIGPVVAAFFLATLGFAAFESTLALFLRDTLDLGEENSYYFFAFIGIVLLLTQGLLYRRLARRVSEPTFMVMGILLMAIGLAGLGVVTMTSNVPLGTLRAVPFVGPSIETAAANKTWVDEAVLFGPVFISLAFAVMGFAFLTPSAQALISRRTDINQQGEILGVNQSAAAMARILGPAIGLTLLKINPLLPYGFGAVLLLLMLPLMPRVRRGS
jgi:MFS transporter, DHA1 family, tetracycline resistance protein